MEIGASPPSNLFVSANVIKIFLLLIRTFEYSFEYAATI